MVARAGEQITGDAGRSTPKTIAAVEVNLRPKNQITLPATIARLLDVEPGDRFVVEVREGEPDELHVRRIRGSYAGVLAGVYGKPDEAAVYLRDERGSWD